MELRAEVIYVALNGVPICLWTVSMTVWNGTPYIHEEALIYGPYKANKFMTSMMTLYHH